jgi:hypothetical protein
VHIIHKRINLTVKYYSIDSPIILGNIVSSQKKKEALKCEIDLMEKEIIYLTGKRRQKARKAYFRLLNSCGKTSKIDEPIYLVRS